MASVDLTTPYPHYVRFRDPKWANPDAYARLSVVEITGKDGSVGTTIGPWVHLFDRRTQEAVGEPTPQHTPSFMPPFNFKTFLAEELEEWKGPLDLADR